VPAGVSQSRSDCVLRPHRRSRWHSGRTLERETERVSQSESLGGGGIPGTRTRNDGCFPESRYQSFHSRFPKYRSVCVCVCKGAVDEQKFHLSLQRLEAMRLFRASSPRARILNAAYTFICIHSTEVQLVPHVGLFRWCCISKERSGTHLSVSRVRRARSMNRGRL